jgi:hypothetical protein
MAWGLFGHSPGKCWASLAQCIQWVPARRPSMLKVKKCRPETLGAVRATFAESRYSDHKGAADWAEMSKQISELKYIADRYATFAADEARGASEIYERLAKAVAGSAELLKFLATLPTEKRQPNLFLAVVRHLFGVPDSEDQLVDIVRRKHEPIRELMLSRTTQTNEPARCAVLLPLLARLPQPLALLEVGASAGLCLLPDRYGYDYGVSKLSPSMKQSYSPPVFECHASRTVPIPRTFPRIAWRAGIDLNPIDVNEIEETAWLEALVWPGQERRLERFRAALAVAQSDPPMVVKGNLLTDLGALMAQAPEGATLVIFHTAVLAYVVSKAHREQFAKVVRQSKAVWISNEVPSVFPDIARAAPPPPQPGRFLLAIDGTPVAWTGPHGESVDWFGAL